MEPPPPQTVLGGFSINFAARVAGAVLGLIQFGVLAHLFGAGVENDAWQVALSLPMLLLTFLGWSLRNTFITIYVERREREGTAATVPLVNGIFTILVLILGAVGAVLWLGAPWLIPLLAPGFDAERYATAVTLLRWLSPLVLVMALMEFPASMLLAQRRYVLQAISSLFYSAGVVVLTVLLGRQFGITAAAMGGLAGLAVGSIFLWIAIGGIAPRPRPTLKWDDPGVPRIFQLLGPGVIALSTVRINSIVDFWFASRLVTGAITGLSYGSKLTHIPLVVFTGPLLRTVTPVFAQQVARQDTEALIRNLGRYMRIAGFVVCGVAIGLLGLPREIVSVFFERGAFDAEAVGLTGAALRAYAFGMPAFAWRTLLTTVFFTMQDTRTPMKVALVSVAINAAADAVCVAFWGHSGIALSTSIVSWAAAAGLFHQLRRRLGPLSGTATLVAFAKCVAVAGVCAVGAMWIADAVSPMWEDGGFWGRVGVVVASVGPATLAYGLLCYAWDVEDVRESVWRLRLVAIKRRAAQAARLDKPAADLGGPS